MFLNYCGSKEVNMEIITSNHVMEGNLFTSFSKEAMEEKDLPCELR